MDVGDAVGRALETPLVVEIFEWALDIIDANAAGPLLHHPAREPLLEGVEADDEVGDRLFLARRANPHRDHPRQELVIAGDVGDEVEQLFGGVREVPSFAVPWH
jgi:hypothetical protein